MAPAIVFVRGRIEGSPREEWRSEGALEEGFGFLHFARRGCGFALEGVTVKYTCQTLPVKAGKHKMLGLDSLSTSTCCVYIWLWKTRSFR